MRFRPPAVELEPALRCALSWAFADPAQAPLPELDEVAVRFAFALGLGPRLAGKTQRSDTLSGLSADCLDSLQTALHHCAGQEMRRDLAVATAVRLANEIGAPVALLKGVALRASGHVEIATRSIGDLDLLVPAEAAQDLHAALLREGFAAFPVAETEYHLPGVHRQPEGLIEIHRVLLGLRDTQAHRSLTFDDLEAGGHLQFDQASGAWIPTPPILTAHAIVHGLLAHGKDPMGYPMITLPADLIDLDFDNDESLFSRTLRWTSSSLPAEEIQPLRRLCERLRSASFLDQERLDPTSPDEAVLAHIVAGRLDLRYRASLGLRWLQPRLSDRSRASQLADTVRKTLLPSRGEIVVATGDPTADRPWRTRLSAPFRAAGQLILALSSYVMIRFGGAIRPRPKESGSNFPGAGDSRS